MNRTTACHLLTLALVVAASGASCPMVRGPVPGAAPIVFTAPPTLQDVLRTVNANTQRVSQLRTDRATLTIQGLPALRASLAIQTPRNLRLRAQFIGMGQVLDLGSNREMFWALVDAPQLATNLPRAVYFARYDQFRRSRVQGMLPIEPQWLIEAVGLVQFDPTQVHEGPYASGPGRLEVRSRIRSAEGDLTRSVVVDANYGWILEQHLYDAQGQLIASALASEHRYDPLTGVSLPHHVEIRLPAPNPAIYLDVERYAINQALGDPTQLWTMPTYDGYQLIDLSDPNMQVPPAPPNAGVQPPAGPLGPAYPAAGFRPRYRGYSARR